VKYPFVTEAKFWLAGRLGYALIQIICRTLRFTLSGIEAYDETIRTHGQCIIAFWHGRQFILVHTFHRRGVYVLVSRSADGEYIHRVLHRSGNNTVRGSTSRGGSDAYTSLAGLLAQKHTVAFTPDGPRGPAGEVGPGVIALSSRSGVPIMPLATAAYPCWRLRSWDRFLIPKFFARGAHVVGQPFIVPPNLTDIEFEQWRQHLKQELDRITLVADQLVGMPGAGG